MKKTLSININGVLFYMEEDGYELLQDYLKKINTYFANYNGKKDIIEDIENRITEIFLTKLAVHKQVIMLEDVQALVSQMGDITDFEIIEDPSEQTQPIENKGNTSKKIFRSEENKIIAGVASGLAAYFGVGEFLVRLLFILTTFLGGLGIIMYLIMWVLIPTAKTITDKVAMKGEAITLNNIENSLKSILTVKKDENQLIKLIMMPFHLLARFLDFLKPIFDNIVKYVGLFLRKTVGVFLSSFALLSILTATFVALIAFGMIEGDAYWGEHIPLNVVLNSVESLNWVTFFGYLGIICVATLLLFIGLSIIFNKQFFNNLFVWGLSATSFVCILLFLILIPQTVVHFREDYSIKKEENFVVDKNKVVLLNIDRTHYYRHESLIDIKGYSGNTIKVVKIYSARGKDKQEALQNIEMVDYQVSKKDSLINFDNAISYKKGAKFRNQFLSLEIFVPYNQSVAFSEGFQNETSIYSNVSHNSNDAQKVWFFTPNGLECKNCHSTPMVSLNNSELKKISVEKFKEIEIIGNIEVHFEPSSSFEVRISSDLAKVNVSNNQLSIISHSRNAIQVVVYAPTIEKISLFDGVKAHFNLPFVEQLQVILKKDATLELNGKGNTLVVDAENSKLNAFEWIAQKASINLKNESEAYVNVTQQMSATTKQNSKIYYQGNADITNAKGADIKKKNDNETSEE